MTDAFKALVTSLLSEGISGPSYRLLLAVVEEEGSAYQAKHLDMFISENVSASSGEITCAFDDWGLARLTQLWED